MDFVSHALWGGFAFGRRTRKAFFKAAGISILPDVLTEGLFGLLFLLNIGGMPNWDHGHPNITAYPLWAQNFYNLTHSFIVFALAFFLIWAIRRKPVWIVGAWGLHILIDIPTHSIELFPTPFLWPLSEYKFNGVGWHNPIVLGVNILLLLGIFLLWLWQRKRNQ
jgi:membrane-bound metal-dependent hydrolase YbcI (DUF457 family)